MFILIRHILKAMRCFIEVAVTYDFISVSS